MSISNVHIRYSFLVLLSFTAFSYPHGHGTKKDHAHVHEEEKPFKFKFSGYVRMDGFFDTRQNVDYWRGLDIAFPKKKKLDPNGCDIDDKSQFNMVPYPSLRLKVTGPDLWGAKTSAWIKTDFVGKIFQELVDDGLLADYGTLRVQHAVVYFDWEKTHVRAGLYYHPMTILRFSSDTVSINAGEMFDPFQYSTHVYVKHKFKFLEFIGTVGKIYHRRRFRDAIAPNFMGQINVSIDKHILCAGADFRMEVPRLETDRTLATGIDTHPTGYKTQKKVKSICAFGIAKFVHGNLTSISRFTYAENAYIYGLIGGYGTKERNPVTDRRDYTNLRSLSFWTDLVYNNKKWEIGSFLGFTKNIGSQCKILKNPSDEFLRVGLGLDIDKIFRIQPRFRLFRGAVTFGIEYEYTRAWHGTMNECGKVDNTVPVANNRIIGSIVYAWS